MGICGGWEAVEGACVFFVKADLDCTAKQSNWWQVQVGSNSEKNTFDIESVVSLHLTREVGTFNFIMFFADFWNNICP